MRSALLIFLLPLLASCSDPKQESTDAVAAAVQTATEAVAGTMEQSEDIRDATAPAVTATVLALQESVEAITPEPLAQPVPAESQELDPVATALIVRWEVGSEAQYTRKYQGVICPGGASGPTIGIGYDLGHQTPATIRHEWAGHPDVDRLAAGSGKTGPAACAAYRKAHRDIVVPLGMAKQVFEESTLPAYTRMAERALGRETWKGLPPPFKSGMKSLGYNRGWSMTGSRNTEKVVIKRDCAPRRDAECGATQLIAMCRIWEGTPNYTGLCNRRKDEARVIRS